MWNSKHVMIHVYYFTTLLTTGFYTVIHWMISVNFLGEFIVNKYCNVAITMFWINLTCV